MSEMQTNKKADYRFPRDLRAKGLLSDEAFLAAQRMLRPASEWFSWAQNALLFLGSALVLAGIIFFFAYNWKSMGPFLKFILLEAGILVCIISMFVLKLKPVVAKVLLLSASILTGILLAVFGQTYQTGADAYELFVSWAIVILPWVIVSRFAALWIGWLIIVNTGATLYWIQVAEPVHDTSFDLLCVLLAGINCAALVLREFGANRSLAWLQHRWHRGLLLAAVLIALCIPTVKLITEMGVATDGTAALLGSVLWVVAIVGGYICYRHRLPDMLPLALIVMAACLVVLVLIGRIVFEVASGLEEWLFLFMGFIIIGVISCAAVWLRRTAAAIARGNADD
jgi:uncharacterized membrane protein